MYGVNADRLDGMSVFSAAISGSMDSSQCRFEYPKVACRKGINRGGSAASESSIFGNNGFEKEMKTDMDIRTGSVVGYKMVAGSKAAGT